jgi:uncharacterized membrane protein YccC
MLHRHHLAYAALVAVYTAMAVILLIEGALALATCALTVALIYAALCASVWPPARRVDP